MSVESRSISPRPVGRPLRLEPHRALAPEKHTVLSVTFPQGEVLKLDADRYGKLIQALAEGGQSLDQLARRSCETDTLENRFWAYDTLDTHAQSTLGKFEYKITRVKNEDGEILYGVEKDRLAVEARERLEQHEAEAKSYYANLFKKPDPATDLAPQETASPTQTPEIPVVKTPAVVNLFEFVPGLEEAVNKITQQYPKNVSTYLYLDLRLTNDITKKQAKRGMEIGEITRTKKHAFSRTEAILTDIYARFGTMLQPYEMRKVRQLVMKKLAEEK